MENFEFWLLILSEEKMIFVMIRALKVLFLLCFCDKGYDNDFFDKNARKCSIYRKNRRLKFYE